MNRITVYVKGDPGFKPAIITKLGRAWIQKGRDVDENLISFLLPEKMLMEELKAFVGKDIVSDFDVHFFDHIPVDSQPELPWKFIPGQPFRMSIWANSDSHLTVKHGDESLDSMAI